MVFSTFHFKLPWIVFVLKLFIVFYQLYISILWLQIFSSIIIVTITIIIISIIITISMSSFLMLWILSVISCYHFYHSNLYFYTYQILLNIKNTTRMHKFKIRTVSETKLFKVGNKDTKTVSVMQFWCLQWELWAMFFV